MTANSSPIRISNDSLQNHAALLKEGADIVRYLTGTSPPVEILDRYVEAHKIVFSGEPSQAERSTVAFVRQHPEALPYIDAALGILHPHGLLRNKILLMLALLETTPHFADMFFPEPLSKGAAFIRIVAYGLRGILHTIIGLTLYPFTLYQR